MAKKARTLQDDNNAPIDKEGESGEGILAQEEVNRDERQLIQDALDRFVAKQATEADFNTMLDRALMHHASADQACQFIQAVPKQTEPVPADVLFAWAQTLRVRWVQAQSGRKSAGRTGRRADGTATFKVPAAWRSEADEALTANSAACSNAVETETKQLS